VFSTRGGGMTDNDGDAAGAKSGMPAPTAHQVGVALGIAVLFVGVTASMAPAVYPPSGARSGPLVYVPLLLVFAGFVGWVAYGFSMIFVASIVHKRQLALAAGLALVSFVPWWDRASGPEESLGRRACNFGPLGVAKGTVWFKVTPPAPGPNEGGDLEEYVIDMVWGAAHVRKTVTLTGPTYFAFKQRSWKAPGADITVEPTDTRPTDALISCGFGRPPSGTTRIDLSGCDFDPGGCRT
jgi:hypothetical protein